MAKPPGRTYRYYTGKPLWPFGAGLSLTTFALQCVAPSDGSGLGKYDCIVSNIGSLDGDEVVLVFHRPTDHIRAQSSRTLPLKRLVAFKRLHVIAGASSVAQFEITSEMLALPTGDGSKVVYQGTHELIF